MPHLKNKVFVITGSGSGIGRALALAMDKRGVRLALNDVNADNLNATAQMLNTDCLIDAFSVADAHAWTNFKSKVLDKFSHVDGIINNAGIAHEAVSVEHLREEDLRLVMDINFYGVVNGTQCFLPELAKRPTASLVNVSSIFGISAVGLQSAYCASKFAVRGYTETLRMEAISYYPNLCVSVVHPGGIQTNIAETAITAGSRTHEERQKDKQNFSKTFITSPQKAAETIIAGIEKNQERILIGVDAKIMDATVRLMPVSYSKKILGQMKKQGLVDEKMIQPLNQRVSTRGGQ